MARSSFSDLIQPSDRMYVFMDRRAVLQRLLDGMPIPVETNTVSAGSINTHYLSAGSGAPVVLLHGGGGGAMGWGYVMGPLSKHYRVIAPDVVGYGESDKPDAAYDPTFFSTWLGDFLDALELSKVPLVGNSLGGAIALQFTLRNPQRVERLALIGSAGLGPRALPRGALLGLLWMNLFPSKAAFNWMRRYLVHEAKNVRKDAMLYNIAVARMPGGKNATRRGRGKIAEPLTSAQLEQITQSTLLLWGEKDRMIPLEHAQRAQQHMPNAQLHIVRDAGHVPFADRPEDVNDILIRFLQGRL